MQEAKTYQKMLEEVEGILAEIAAPDVDLDKMVTQVEKGYTLIQAMRERLDATKEKIEQLHRKYDAQPPQG